MTYIDELHDVMMSSADYRAAHEASRPVYELASALIGARAHSDLTQAQIAERMGTTQSAVARLEGGRANPSMRTLERYAKATGTRLKINFEPITPDTSQSENETREDVKPPHTEVVPEGAGAPLPVAT